MARKIMHQLVDDLDGTVLEIGDGETVMFSLDGVAYEIDLTDENADRLRDALAPFIDAGRRISAGSAIGRTAARTQRRSSQRDYAPIRAWAAENGYEVSERGRVPASVLDAYDAAH
ncbi:Lsr2 family protein [Microbacterium sp. cf332]|uniref:histone-like nucleoid-structuring protein Lsr2 n=1 Tax=Microbacterium sp. cf332 TaxID=1761804 RepID=UPI0008922600|nr:Lsr2 family protein [Microbacterium sp. cf332]SDQ89722.1 Lsr2 protein [Microbacterium sp. cf332]